MSHSESTLAVHGILFDMWGTLVYNIPHRGRAEYDLIAHRIGHSTEEIWRQWGVYSKEALRGEIKSGEERARMVLRDLGGPPEMASEMAQFEYDNRSGDVHFFPEVPQMLARLREMGYRTCMISNCNYLTPSVVERMGLPGMLDAVVLSCEVGLVKPEVEIYRLGASMIGLEPRDCLFVGDGGDGELDGATEAGCKVALVAQERGHAFRFPTKTYPYDIRLTHITDLLRYLPGPSAPLTGG